MQHLNLLNSQEAGTRRGWEAVAIMYDFVRIMGKHGDEVVMVEHHDEKYLMSLSGLKHRHCKFCYAYLP